jgi:hypothetical protein
VLHTYEPGTPIQRVQQANLDEMEQWVTNIAKDSSPSEKPARKSGPQQTAGVTDACYTKDGQSITDMQRCAQMFPVVLEPRLNAGLPMARRR